MKKTLFGIVLLASGIAALTHAGEAAPAAATQLMAQDLPALSGQQGLMLEVSYAPGGTSLPHRHNANTFVYVLEGSIVMQVQGGEEKTLVPGDTFYESREDIHAVSRNASATAPARFLVFIIKDRDAPVSVPVAAGQ